MPIEVFANSGTKSGGRYMAAQTTTAIGGVDSLSAPKPLIPPDESGTRHSKRATASLK